MAKEIFCAYGIDVDAVAGWLGSYGGEDSPDDISRGLFAGEVGTPRLLKLFEKYGLKTTWFIPGHSIETFPEQTKMVVDAGHEIGMHGYSHENPISMTPEQEEAVLVKCIGLIEQVCGRRPTGYVAPWWEFSNVTNELLLKHGIKYDHSLMHDDYHPYYVRVGDSWTKIDYSKKAEEWMKPLVRGTETDLIEIPGKLVARRSTADDVHQDGAEQPRLRQPSRHRADLARPVRLRVPRVRLRGLPDDDPPGRERQARRCCSCTSGSSSTSTSTMGFAGSLRRDRRRLRQAVAQEMKRQRGAAEAGGPRRPLLMSPARPGDPRPPDRPCRRTPPRPDGPARCGSGDAG